MPNSDTVIKVENLSKVYRLGQIGATSLREELERFWAKVLNKETSSFSGDSRYDKSSNEFWALRNLSFEVNKGDIVGIIGRNGAGKSTLLKLISKITEPTKGEILYKGKLASLLEVGTGFHPELSGRDNIYLNGAILGMRKTETAKKFDEIVDFSGIEHHLDTPVKRYSSGMYVRLAFAIAAHLDPDILIIDEVLAVGDSHFQNKCIAKMRDIATKDGKTILFVSHNMAIIQAFCKKAILMKDGQIISQGPIEKVVPLYSQSLEQEANQDLSKRESRKGNGKSRFSSILIHNSRGNLVNTLESGESATFIFDHQGNAKPTTCIFTVYNNLGQPIANFNSAITSKLDKETKDHRFECHINSLVLTPGLYTINAALEDSGEVLDHLESAISFEVEISNTNSRLSANNPNFGCVILPHRWLTPER